MVLFLGQKNQEKEPRKNAVFLLGLRTMFLERGLFIWKNKPSIDFRNSLSIFGKRTIGTRLLVGLLFALNKPRISNVVLFLGLKNQEKRLRKIVVFSLA